MSRILLAFAWMAACAFGQSLALEATAGPSSFSGPGQTGSTGAGLTAVLATEILTLRLEQVPTIPEPPPLIAPLRRVQVWAGVETPAPFPSPFFPPSSLVYLDFAAPVAPFLLLNSLTGAGPAFGPGLQGKANVIELGLPAMVFPPFAVPDLLIQALAEDTNSQATGQFLLSNPVRVKFVDPAAAFPPSLSAVQPASGADTGGEIVLLSGMNFPAQTQWTTFPPVVRFGGVPSPQVAVLGKGTILCVTPPAPVPTSPPFASCAVGVTVENHPLISPLGVPSSPAIPFLYTTGLIPAGVSFAHNPASPEGGTPNSLTGSSFLNGIQLEFTSVSNPSLGTTIAVPVLPDGFTVPFQTPPFCTGDVLVRTTNCDGGSSLVPQVLTYRPMDPAASSFAPAVALPPEFGGGSLPAVQAAGGPFQISGSDFLSAASPLATAPTVPASTFHPTRVEIGGIVETALAATSSSVLSGTTVPRPSSGLVRSQLGLQDLVLFNPPCVNGPPYTAERISPPYPLLVQDGAPPGLQQVLPSAIAGEGDVVVLGSNFFATGGTLFQDFESLAGTPVILSLDPAQVHVPAVRFEYPSLSVPPRFARRVTLIADGVLRFTPPPSPAPGTPLPVLVTVFNPDLRSSGAFDAEQLPPIVPPSSPAVLDEALLRTWFEDGGSDPALINGGGTINPSVLLGSPSVLIVRNPSPGRDRLRDPWSAEFGSACYEWCVLFNTLESGTGEARPFRFDHVSVPATLTLPAGGKALVLDLHPFPLAAPCVQTIPAGAAVRVIFKAVGHRFEPAGSIPAQFRFPNTADAPNWPLFLASSTLCDFAGFVHLGGDAFLPDDAGAASPCSPGTAPCPAPITDAYRYSTEATLPPAGGGQGGRGGRPYASDGLHAGSLPPVSLLSLLSLPPSVVAGRPGSPPSSRPPPTQPVASAGAAGTGSAYIGLDVRAGSGGGGGHGVPGSAGNPQVPGPFGGIPGGGGGMAGNASHFSSYPGAPVLPFSVPGLTADELVYGAEPADFSETLLVPQLESLLHGGSGGGGGGLASDGILKLRLGGRGGNGGGALLLASNGFLALHPGAFLLAPGGGGRRGFDASFPGAPPPIGSTTTLGGSGGGGAGGTILLLSSAEVMATWNPSATALALYPPVFAVPALPVIDLRGGGSEPPGLTSGPGAGGSGGAGRWRAMASSGILAPGTGLLSTVCTFTGPAVGGCTGTGLLSNGIVPVPPGLALPPVAPATALVFFGYPQ